MDQVYLTQAMIFELVRDNLFDGKLSNNVNWNTYWKDGYIKITYKDKCVIAVYYGDGYIDVRRLSGYSPNPNYGVDAWQVVWKRLLADPNSLNDLVKFLKNYTNEIPTP